MTPTDEPSVPWLRNNLVALSSAAVVAVYAAGYFRTRQAADRFAAQAVERTATAVAAPAGRAELAGVASATAGAEAPAPKGSGAAERVVGTAATPVAPRPSGTTPAGPPVAAGGFPSPTTEPAEPVTAPVSPPAPTPSPPPPVAKSPDSTAQSPDKSKAPYKDGTYSGWGTSRHGDIQATVDIMDGRIVAASISQCLTRYSCSWISALPQQVVTRQSPDVDFVSGATQSTNAFYYAVVEALAKAK